MAEDTETEIEVIVTPTAKSKCFRLLSERRIRQKVIHRAGRIYFKGQNKYHLVFSDYAIVVAVEVDALVVVTQMHAHADYRTDNVYRRVDDFGEVPEDYSIQDSE